MPEAETVDAACKLAASVSPRAASGVYGMIKVRARALGGALEHWDLVD